MKEPLVERHTIIVTDHQQYRIRPNPDAPVGYRGGAVLDWQDHEGERGWQGYFHIEPDAIPALAEALAEIAADLGGQE